MAAKHAAGESQQNASHTIVTPDGPQLEEVLLLMADGKVKLEVAKVCLLGSCVLGVCLLLLPLFAAVQTLCSSLPYKDAG